MNLNFIIWFVFLIFKLFYLLFGHFVFINISTLGDTFRYLSSETNFKITVLYSSTELMDFLGGISGHIFGTSFGSLPFCILNFVCTLICLRSLRLNNYSLIIILLILSFPSYGLWTSVASKEAIVSSSMFIIFLQYYRIINHIKINKTLLIITYYVIIVFKIQYFPVLLFLNIFLLIYHKYKFINISYFLYYPVVCIFGIYFVILYCDEIDRLAFLVASHFDVDASSTRKNFILVNKYDFFRNAPYGMFIGMFGPTLSEANLRFTHFLSFAESTLLILIFATIFYYRIYVCLIYNKFSLNSLLLPITVLILFAAVHYPFGIMNPGSAIRYRCSFYPIIFLSLFLYNNYRRKFITFRSQ